MRLVLINPNTTTAVTERMLLTARAAAPPGTEVVAVAAPFGAPYIQSRSEMLVGGSAVLAAIGVQARAFDAVVIAAFGDPGLPAARELLAVPVVGIAEAACLTACFLGGRFGIATFVPRLIPLMCETVVSYGLGGRLAGARGEALDPQLIASEPDRVLEVMTRLGRDLLDQDRADVIVLGGGPLSGFALQLRDRLGVPVLDGVECATRQAVLLASMALPKPLRGSYAAPGKQDTSLMPESLRRLFA